MGQAPVRERPKWVPPPPPPRVPLPSPFQLPSPPFFPTRRGPMTRSKTRACAQARAVNFDADVRVVPIPKIGKRRLPSKEAQQADVRARRKLTVVTLPAEELDDDGGADFVPRKARRVIDDDESSTEEIAPQER